MESGVIHNLFIVAHVFSSIFGWIAANASEKSIITDRTNKHLFFAISMLYSLLFARVLYSLIIGARMVEMMRNIYVLGAFLAFILIQLLVYRLLNRFEILEE